MSRAVLLPRWLSRCGVASRRAAEQAVHDGRVSVDGRVCRDVLRSIVPGRTRVELDGIEVAPTAAVWLALNKPRGVVTTTADPEGRPTVLDGIPEPAPGLAPVGRLDRDSCGLLLLTNEHALAAALLDPKTHVEKVYRVKVRGVPGAATLRRLATEVVVEGLGPFDVQLLSENPTSAWLRVTLSEGKNRQIRRQLAAVGHEVEVLIRVSFGPIALGDLAPGAVRPLAASEVRSLRAAAGLPG